MTAEKYAYDPEFVDMLAFLPAQLGDLSTVEGIRELRTGGLAALMPETPDRDDVAKQDRVVPGPPDAPDVPVRVYTPVEDADGPRGALLSHRDVHLLRPGLLQPGERPRAPAPPQGLGRLGPDILFGIVAQRLHQRRARGVRLVPPQ